MKKTVTPKIDPQSIIRCGNPDATKLAYMAMFRYAFGRMTYMPDVVIGIIKTNAEHLTMPTLELLDRDLSDEAERYERVWKGNPINNYGMDCDRKAWLEFHEWVKAEIAKRLEADRKVERMEENDDA